MAEEQVDDVDVAAQMGFSSFGSQPKNKKRKTEAVKHEVTTAVTKSEDIQPSKSATERSIDLAPRVSNQQQDDLRALRQGVRNDNGDMVYFMPSFIHDPWEHLRKSKR